MGRSHTDAFSARDNRLARFAKALAHPARVAILRHLIKKQSCMCGDIVDELPLSQSTVSQHLKALQEAGLIQGEIEGTSVCYCIDPAAWEKAKQQLGELLASFSDRSFGCCPPENRKRTTQPNAR